MNRCPVHRIFLKAGVPCPKCAAAPPAPSPPAASPKPASAAAPPAASADEGGAGRSAPAAAAAAKKSPWSFLEPILALVILAVCGCSVFDAHQYAPDGTETRVRIKTFLDGQSDVSKLRTTQTDKTQGVSVGSLSQESSGTNAVEALKALDSILGKLR